MSRIKQPLNQYWTIFWGVIGVLVLVVGYEVLSNRQHARNATDTTIPSMVQMINGLKVVCTPRENPLIEAFGGVEADKTFVGQLYKTPIFNDITSTYGRLIKGLLLGCVLSTLLGMAMGCYEWIAALFLPALSLLAKVPGTAMLAVFFVLVGTGESMFATMIGFGVLPILTQAVYLSAKHDIHEEEINKAYTLGASNMEAIYNVVFKQILPKVLENIRLQIGPAMVYLIAAEMLVGQVGMGYQIRMQQRLLNMNIVYDYLLILGISGLLMDHGMLIIRRTLCPWYSRFR